LDSRVDLYHPRSVYRDRRGHLRERRLDSIGERDEQLSRHNTVPRGNLREWRLGTVDQRERRMHYPPTWNGMGLRERRMAATDQSGRRQHVRGDRASSRLGVRQRRLAAA
jgi:hypothetical protein